MGMKISDWPTIIASAGLQVETDENFDLRNTGDLADFNISDKTNSAKIVWNSDPRPSGGSDKWVADAWWNQQPTAQVWIDSAGKWHFIGSEKVPQPLFRGADTSTTIIIEFDTAPGTEQPPAALLESLRRGTAAILQAKGVGSEFFSVGQVGHQNLSTDTERNTVQGLIRSGTGGSTAPNGGSLAFVQDPFKQGVFNYLFMGNKIDALSLLLRGDLAPVNDQQLITTIQAIVTASLRSFMSGPDGSFIAFFPDYFGLYGDKDEPSYKLTLEDIELVDFKIDVNDDELTTDVFVAGQSLGVTGSNPIGEAQWLASSGVVNIRQQSAMAMILGDQFADETNFKPDEFYARFGLRPLKAQFPAIHEHLLEYLQALTIFQRKWSAQYRTQVQFTFMPELYPGMRILIKSHNVTVFVEEVVHTGSYETGFTTTATISSPASVNGGGIYGMVVGKI